jgi:hypothetical protein
MRTAIYCTPYLVLNVKLFSGRYRQDQQGGHEQCSEDPEVDDTPKRL